MPGTIGACGGLGLCAYAQLDWAFLRAGISKFSGCSTDPPVGINSNEPPARTRIRSKRFGATVHSERGRWPSRNCGNFVATHSGPEIGDPGRGHKIGRENV